MHISKIGTVSKIRRVARDRAPCSLISMYQPWVRYTEVKQNAVHEVNRLTYKVT
ncbi:MAG: hypothetical protein QG646_1025 [Euryarchaeota archaeon]|nr:hypothetical protein [Euryarchaeota archaeon]